MKTVFILLFMFCARSSSELARGHCDSINRHLRSIGLFNRERSHRPTDQLRWLAGMHAERHAGTNYSRIGKWMLTFNI